MADFLKFINELTVNGKPVDEEEDDDYTTTPEDDDDDTPALDLDTGDETTTEDDNEPVEDDDDYTIEPEDPEPAEDGEGNDPAPKPEDGEGGSEGDVDDEPTLDLDPGDDPAPAAEEPADTGGDEPALDLDPGDDPEPAGDESTGDAGGDEPTGEEPANEPAEEPGGDIDTNPDDTGDTDDGLDMGTDDDDYTAAGDDPDSTNDDLGDAGADDTSTDDNSSEDSELEAKIKQTEAEIFNTLSDDEKAIKNRQLIDNFVDLKKITKVFLEKVQTVTVTEENDQILTFVDISLLDLHNMITDYIITRYSKKSYIENFVTYQQFILTIEQLKEIVSKLKIDENPQK